MKKQKRSEGHSLASAWCLCYTHAVGRLDLRVFAAAGGTSITGAVPAWSQGLGCQPG